ncbi:MAG: RidA family protein [Bacillota bacterium]|nr:RidA family protein [Bacillota bacterium]
MKIIKTNSAPEAIGPYSQAANSGNLLFTSGQLGINPKSGVIAEGIEAQVEQAINNIGAILNKEGLTYENVIKTTCFLSDIKNFQVFNEIYGRFFTGKPARSCVEVSALPKGALVEIEVIAEK